MLQLERYGQAALVGELAEVILLDGVRYTQETIIAALKACDDKTIQDFVGYDKKISKIFLLVEHTRCARVWRSNFYCRLVSNYFSEVP